MSKESKKSRSKRTDAAKQARERQKLRTVINKTRKLTKHVLRQPNDTQAAKALDGSKGVK